jgi:hypothetical protein
MDTNMFQILKKLRDPAQAQWDTTQIVDNTQQQQGAPDPLAPTPPPAPPDQGPSPSSSALAGATRPATEFNPASPLDSSIQAPSSMPRTDMGTLDSLVRRNNASRKRVTGQGGL